MKTFVGIALGFMVMPATIGIIGLFTWTGIRFDLSRSDTALGGVLGLATLMVAAGIGLYMVTRS